MKKLLVIIAFSVAPHSFGMQIQKPKGRHHAVHNEQRRKEIKQGMDRLFQDESSSDEEEAEIINQSTGFFSSVLSYVPIASMFSRDGLYKTKGVTEKEHRKRKKYLEAARKTKLQTVSGFCDECANWLMVKPILIAELTYTRLFHGDEACEKIKERENELTLINATKYLFPKPSLLFPLAAGLAALYTALSSGLSFPGGFAAFLGGAAGAAPPIAAAFLVANILYPYLGVGAIWIALLVFALVYFGYYKMVVSESIEFFAEKQRKEKDEKQQKALHRVNLMEDVKGALMALFKAPNEDAKDSSKEGEKTSQMRRCKKGFLGVWGLAPTWNKAAISCAIAALLGGVYYFFYRKNAQEDELDYEGSRPTKRCESMFKFFAMDEEDNRSVSPLSGLDDRMLAERRAAEDMLQVAKEEEALVRYSIETNEMLDEAQAIHRNSVLLQIDESVLRSKMSDEHRAQLLANKDKLLGLKDLKSLDELPPVGLEDKGVEVDDESSTDDEEEQ